jgi:hypothetical protein
LVLIPAQYLSTGERLGIERRFTTMTHTVYYSNTADSIPPSIWGVKALIRGQMSKVQVEVTDFSGVIRVAVAYTIGDGIWRVVDLAQSDLAHSLWEGEIPGHADLAYFVQAVDAGGNVAYGDNKGRYFRGTHDLYMPLILNRSQP